MTAILFFAFGISLTMKEWVEAGVLAFVILANAIVGFLQEYGSEKTMQALRRLSSPVARVLRGGHVVEVRQMGGGGSGAHHGLAGHTHGHSTAEAADRIHPPCPACIQVPADELVPGDIVHLEEGDQVNEPSWCDDDVSVGTRVGVCTRQAKALVPYTPVTTKTKTDQPNRTNQPNAQTTTSTQQVPADVRLLHTVAFAVEEAILTGESVAVTKRSDALPKPAEAAGAGAGAPPLGDRKNMAFFGCLASRGRALAVVTATGMSTELGRIARSIGWVGCRFRGGGRGNGWIGGGG
jgi:magnesium-transporting ATPase (P-type)